MVIDRRAEERKLVERCLAGERQAWDAFARAYAAQVGEAVRHTLLRFGAASALSHADDLVQETFVQVFQKDGGALRQFQGQSSLGRYLRVIAAHRTIDWLRQPKGAAPLPTDAEGSPLWWDRVRGDFPDASAAFQQAELKDRLDRAIQLLPERGGLALKWFYWDGLSARTIGCLLGLEHNTATSLLSRARAQLRRLLEAAP